jgi:hypothetical protein
MDRTRGKGSPEIFQQMIITRMMMKLVKAPRLPLAGRLEDVRGDSLILVLLV